MPAYKNQKTGEWYCIFRVTDWTGKRKQIKKSCFARRADALAYEREYLVKSSRTTKMKFGSWWSSTWRTQKPGSGPPPTK